MSTNYAVLGLAMAAAGVLTDVFGARWVWVVAGGIYLVAALLTLLVTRWLPVAHEDETGLLDAHAEEAASALVAVPGGAYASAVLAVRRRSHSSGRAAPRAAGSTASPRCWRISSGAGEVEARRSAT